AASRRSARCAGGTRRRASCWWAPWTEASRPSASRRALSRRPGAAETGRRLLQRPGRPQRLRAGHLRGVRDGAGVEGGQRRAGDRAARGEERQQDAAESGTPAQSRDRREGERAEDLGPGEARAPCSPPKTSGTTGWTCASPTGSGTWPSSRTPTEWSPVRDTTRSTCLTRPPLSGAPSSSSASASTPHSSVPGPRWEHGGGGEHPRSGGHAGPEDGPGVWGSEGAVGRRARPSVPPSQPVVASCGLDRFLRIHSLDDRRLQHKVYLKSRLNCLLLASRDPEDKGTVDGICQEVKEEDEEEDEVWDTMERVGDTGEQMKRKSTEEEEGEQQQEEEQNEKKEGTGLRGV
uniref:WD repeat domain 74 n=1 Tax=Sphaeramia orbicularis TaxID=375764 RepID=A0A672Y670_9TELE